MELVFRLPTLETPLNSAVETNPERLKNWLVALPHTHLLETSQSILNSLSALNHTRIDGDNRAKLLEHYQVSINMLEAPLEANYVSSGLPAKENAKQAAQLARAMQIELANAYKLIITDRLNSRFRFGSKQIPQLLLKLLNSYQRLLLIC